MALRRRIYLRRRRSGRSGFTDASIDGLLKAAVAEPDGFQLLFVHAAREPEFKAAADRFHAEVTAIAHLQISQVVTGQAWARWAAQLAPTAAIEAIIAWLDAGRPYPDLAADRIRHVIAGVITAAAADSGLGRLPPTACFPDGGQGRLESRRPVAASTPTCPGRSVSCRSQPAIVESVCTAPIP
jgi:hypothetical protein